KACCKCRKVGLTKKKYRPRVSRPMQQRRSGGRPGEPRLDIRRHAMTASFEPAESAQTAEQQAAALELEWSANPRWEGVTRDYSATDVVRLRGRVSEEHTLARR